MMVRPVTEDDTGLKALYEPETTDTSNTNIDIIAIHGIGAHPDDSWSKNIGPEADPQYVNWLKQPGLLPEATPRARIMRYGYESRWFGDDGEDTVRLKASTIAQQLLMELVIEREDFPHRPLIFIAHCFGGLVVLKALRQAFDNPDKWSGIFAMTAGLVFFGTPFRGTEGMSQSEMVKAALSRYRPDQVEGDSLRILVPGDEFLQDLVDRFLETRRGPHQASLACFYETKSSDVGKIVGISSRREFVVNEASGTLDQTNLIEKYPLARTHFDINKFGKATEPSYKVVRRVIIRMATGAHELVFARMHVSDDVANIDGRKDNSQLLSLLPSVHNALFNAYDKRHEPECLPNTRVDVLQQIRSWADRQDRQCIFWLAGLVGTGKSTIARTIARTYYEEDRLGASFFFSTSNGDAGHAGKFFTSIAVQLATKSPPLKRYICDAIAKYGNIAEQSPRDQWYRLIYLPLSMLDSKSIRRPLVIVVDALDECNSEEDIRILVQYLAKTGSLRNARLRILLTSKPKPPIRYIIDRIPTDERHEFILHDIPEEIINQDIYVFFEHNLRAIRQEWNLASSWPDQRTIKLLVQKASRLFVWASTTCQFIRAGKRFAARRLDAILNSENSVVAPEKKLDEIYTTVLKNSIHQDYNTEEMNETYEAIREVLGTVIILFSPLSAPSLALLIDKPEENINATLEDLHAILDIPKQRGHPIRLHHPSLRDFLLDQDRCRDRHFRVVARETHQRLADSCIRLLFTSLKRDILELRAPDIFTSLIESSRVEQYLTPEIQYACHYWVQHLQKSEVNLDDNGPVHKFLRDHFLHWFEALSYMKKTSEGVLAINSLESSMQTQESPNLCAFMHDAKRFTRYNRALIAETPLQTYSSALVFAPETSIIKKQFRDEMPHQVRKVAKVNDKWIALLQTLEGHMGRITSVAFSPDGRQLVSGSDDNTVRLWDIAAGKLLQILEGHVGAVTAVAFSPQDSQHIVSGSDDGRIRLWDATTKQPPQTLEGHVGWIGAVAFSADGLILASGGWDGTLRLWNAATNLPLRMFRGHTGGITSIAFSTNGQELLSGSDDRTVRLWNVVTEQPPKILEGHLGAVTAVAFSPLDSRQLASGSDDCTVRLWNTATKEPPQILRGHTDGVTAVAFSPLKGQQIASGAWDSTLHLWNTATWTTFQTFEGHTGGVTLAFSPDGQQLASGANDGVIRFWDTTIEGLQMLEGHESRIRTVAFSPDYQQLALGTDNGALYLLDTAAGMTSKILKGHTSRVGVMTFSPDSRLLASGADDCTLQLWDTAIGEARLTLRDWGYTGTVTTLAFSPDGQQLASGADNGALRLWNTITGEPLPTVSDWQYTGSSDVLPFSSDGQLLVSGPIPRNVRDWTRIGKVAEVSFSPDGRQVMSNYFQRTLRVWDTATGKTLYKIQDWCHTDKVVTVAFSPNGLLLASGAEDCTIRLWNAATAVLLQTFRGHTSGITAVGFSPDGRYLTSGSDDCTLRLWDVATTLPPQILQGHTGKITAVAFSHNGKQIASGGNDRTLRLWDTSTGTLLQTLEINETIETLSFSIDMSYLVTNRGLVDISLEPRTGHGTSRSFYLRRVFVREDWISQGTSSFLRLPSEFRAIRAAFRGDTAVLGHASGAVSILNFDLEAEIS